MLDCRDYLREEGVLDVGYRDRDHVGLVRAEAGRIGVAPIADLGSGFGHTERQLFLHAGSTVENVRYRSQRDLRKLRNIVNGRFLHFPPQDETFHRIARSAATSRQRCTCFLYFVNTLIETTDYETIHKRSLQQASRSSLVARHFWG